MKKGKKYLESAKLVDKSKLYDTTEAFDVLCKTSVAKFDETVEVHVKLGVDSRHADPSRFAVRSFFRTEPVKPFVPSCSLRAITRRKRKTPVLITSAQKNTSQRSNRKTGSTSTLSSQRPI